MFRTTRRAFYRHSEFMYRMGLWRILAWSIAAIAVWDGAGYFVHGNSVGNSPTLVVLKYVPFGLRLHGAIMLAIALLIVYASHDRPILARRVMFLVFAYSVWISAAFIAGWITTGQIVWGAPSKWFLIAWIALTLAAFADRDSNKSRYR